MDYKGLKYIPPKGSGEYYTVKAGDTLWTIAKNHGLSVDELKALNNLTNNALTIGQTLKVSSTPSTTTPTVPEGNYYTVQKGDSLYSIASKYNTTVDELKKLNKLTTNNLSIGQKLLISSTSAPIQPPISSGTTYTIKPGDTLYNIANKYGVTVDSIKQANALSNNTLTIGKTLIIPTNSQPTTKTYTVQKGDTLYGIASKNGTTVENIKVLNNLISNNLSIGQKLLIP